MKKKIFTFFVATSLCFMIFGGISAAQTQNSFTTTASSQKLDESARAALIKQILQMIMDLQKQIIVLLAQQSSHATLSSISGPSSLKLGEVGTWNITTGSQTLKPSFHYRINWGDGSSDTIDSVVKTPSFSHTYLKAGTFKISSTWWDSDSCDSTGIGEVSCLNKAVAQVVVTNTGNESAFSIGSYYTFPVVPSWKISYKDGDRALLIKSSGDYVGDKIDVSFKPGYWITDSDSKFGDVTYYYDAFAKKWVKSKGLVGKTGMGINPEMATPAFYVLDNTPVFVGTGRWLTYIIPVSPSRAAGSAGFIKMQITGSGSTQDLEDLIKAIQWFKG